MLTLGPHSTGKFPRSLHLFHSVTSWELFPNELTFRPCVPNKGNAQKNGALLVTKSRTKRCSSGESATELRPPAIGNRFTREGT